MIVTLFRSKLRAELQGTPEHDAYRTANARMEELARAMPGFVAVGEIQDVRGERLTVVVFASEESNRAWREHPEHRAAQRRGRDTWYESYDAEVLVTDRVYSFTRAKGRIERRDTAS